MPLLLAAYLTVFTAELIGDKLLYTLSALAMRYRSVPVLCGAGLAFSGKMLAAVMLGGLIAQLPVKVVAPLSAITFFTMALALSFKRTSREPVERDTEHWSRAAVVSFSVVFFSEWGDMGQIAAATLSARFEAPLTVLSAATLAMVTKAALAVTMGKGLAERVPEGILRYSGVSLLFGLGIASLLKLR